jgi:glycine/D-amino acid oxidase-like deaminating enzyme
MPEDATYLRAEAALRESMGFDAEFHTRAGVAFGDYAVHLYDARDATIDPFRFCTELGENLVATGCDIVSSTEVLAIEDQGHRVVTSRGPLRTDGTILAGQGVSARLVGTRRLLAIESRCIATARLKPDALAELGLTPPVAFWGPGWPFVYGRVTPDNRLLFGGGDVVASLSAVLGWLKRRQLQRHVLRDIRRCRDVAIEYAWEGTVMVERDLLPSVGRLGRSSIVVADAATSIPHAALAGLMAAQEWCGGPVEYSDLFSLGRGRAILSTVTGGIGRAVSAVSRLLGA